MKRCVAVMCVLAFCGMARADDKSNPTGTWKYTADVDGNSIDVTMKLKLEGDKLTGKVGVMDMESKIEDAKIKDGNISFKVVFDFAGNKISIKYSGKVEGDVFKGKREIERDGEVTKLDFEAKRVKE
jgi:hypothetical protein